MKTLKKHVCTALGSIIIICSSQSIQAAPQALKNIENCIQSAVTQKTGKKKTNVKHVMASCDTHIKALSVGMPKEARKQIRTQIRNMAKQKFRLMDK